MTGLSDAEIDALSNAQRGGPVATRDRGGVLAQIDAQQANARATQRPHVLTDADMDAAVKPGGIALNFTTGAAEGLRDMVRLPQQAAGWVAEKLGAPEMAAGYRAESDLTKAYNRAFVDIAAPPQTAAERVARQSGHAVGASAIPYAGTAAMASRMAAVAPTTTGRAIVQTMGENITRAPVTSAVLDSASAASGAGAAQTAKEYDVGPVGQAAAGLAGMFVPGMALAYRPGTNTSVGTQTGRTIAQQRADDTVRDAASFASQDVRTFGPSFNQGPVASVGKQLTETPIIGAPLRNNLDETYFDAARAIDRIATQISPNATAERAGQTVQRGLERYRENGLTALEPDRLRAIGVEPFAPVQRQTIMSTGAARDQAAAEPIRQMIGAVTTAQPRSAMPTRASAEMMSPTELRAIATTPSQNTSFAAKSEALYERAWNMLPNMMRVNGSANPNRVAAVNTRNTLDQVRTEIGSQISGQGVLRGDLAERILNNSSHFSVSELRQIRTELGRALGDYNPTHQSLSRTQLRRLYGAISEDIDIGLGTLADRAALRTRQPGANRVAVEEAQQAARALHAMRRADAFYRAGQARMDRFLGAVQADSPEAAARRLVSASTDGLRGNSAMFRSAMGVLRPEERAEFGALVVRYMGEPIPSAKGVVQESGFSPQSFLTRYRQMSPEARDAVFTPEHQRAITDLYNIANRIANVEALANTSRSGTNTMNMGGALAGAGSMLRGDFATPLAIGASGLATSVLMSSPQYTRWMVQYVHLRAAVRAGSDRTIGPLMSHIGSLEAAARTNPALVPVVLGMREDLEALKTRKPQ